MSRTIKTLERNLIIAGTVISLLWGGGLLAIYRSRPPAEAVAPGVEVAPAPAAEPAPAAVATPYTGIFAGIESSSAPAVVDGLPSADDQREQIEAFWSEANGNNANSPHGRWEDRTGNIVPATMPATGQADDPLKASTLVTVHIKDLSTRSAMTQLSKQSGVRFSLDQNQYWQGRSYPKISLDADNQPLLEVVNEFCCKTGLAPTSNKSWGMAEPRPPSDAAHKRMQLTLQDPDNAMGPWAVSGRFAFEIQQISHTAQLANEGGSNDPLHISIGVEHEPGMILLSKIQSPVVTEAVDEKGNKLIGSSQVLMQVPQARRGFFQSLFFGSQQATVNPNRRNWAFNHQSIFIDLSYPPDAGRTITRLRATETLLVQTASQKVETAVKPGETAPAKEVGGFSYIVGPLTVMSPQQITCQVTFKRGTRSAEDFDAFSAAVNDLRPTLLDEQGGEISNMQNTNSSFSGASVVFNFFWYPQNGHSSNNDAGKPSKLVFGIPTAWKLIDVPIQFDNLPLP